MMTDSSDATPWCVNEGFWAALQANRKAGWGALRDAGPVVERDGVYYVTGRDEVAEVLRNPQTFPTCGGHRAFDVVDLPYSSLVVDPEQHKRRRLLLQTLLGGSAVAGLMPFMASQAAAAIDTVIDDGGCDAMAAVAVPFPAQVLQALLGLPTDDWAQLVTWRNTILDRRYDGAVYLSAVFALFGYFAAAVAARRHNLGRSGLLSGLLAGGFTDAEAIGMGVELVVAGPENVSHAIGAALLALADNRQLQAQLRADPRQIKPFIEETLRLEPPGQGMARQATRDTVLGGVLVPAGAALMCRTAVVNHEEGNTITVGEDGRITSLKHFAFGGGPHRCPGAFFARTQMAVVLTEWLRRIPEFGLAPGWDPGGRVDIVYRGGSFGWPGLPLRWAKRDASENFL